MTRIDECPICKSQVFSRFMTCIDHSVSHESFEIVKCNQCNLLATSPLPSDSEMTRYYISPAYTSHAGEATNITDNIYFAARRFTLKWKLKLINSASLPEAGKKLLDVGCGTGQFLKTAKLKGWQAFGTEPSPEARSHADAMVAQNIHPFISDVQNMGHKFQAITLWHVLEHIHTLNNTIQELKNMLLENGTMFIAVPNHSSWDSQQYKEYWAGYDVPRHIWHFNKETMTALLAKNGLKVNRIIPMRLDAFYVSLLSEKYKNKGALTIAGTVNAVLHGLRSNSKATNTSEYSSLIYVAMKKNENS